jgi:hypothetical protein
VSKQHSVNIKFNDEDWAHISHGAKLLWADGKIPKPNTYSFLKWVGLTFASALEEKHGGD